MKGLISFLIPFMLFNCIVGGVIASAPLLAESGFSPVEERTGDIDPDRPDYANNANNGEVEILAGGSLAVMHAELSLASHYVDQNGWLHVVGMLENRSDQDYTGMNVVVTIIDEDGNCITSAYAESFFQIWPAHVGLPFEAVFEKHYQDCILVEVDISFREDARVLAETRTHDLVIYKMAKRCPGADDRVCYVDGTLLNDSGNLLRDAQVVAITYYSSAMYIGTITLTDIAQMEELTFSIPVFLPGEITERDFGVYLMSEGEKFMIEDNLIGRDH